MLKRSNCKNSVNNDKGESELGCGVGARVWSRSSGVESEIGCGEHSLVFKKLDISAMRYWGCIRQFL